MVATIAVRPLALAISDFRILDLCSWNAITQKPFGKPTAFNTQKATEVGTLTNSIENDHFKLEAANSFTTIKDQRKSLCMVVWEFNTDGHQPLAKNVEILMHDYE